ncbi:MAG: 50S ribosomal protein L23 [Nitrospiraceae bacterium]|jgi:large subunit ribosomal protein L23|nr:50S ribosomal protein L23 [Nitrospiraceae bacterium]
MKHVFDVIKKPLFTEKGMDMKESDNKILIQVNADANKHEIKQAMEEIFKVKVDKVNVVNIKGKKRRYGKSIGMRSDKRKAIVTLKPGEKLDFIEGV